LSLSIPPPTLSPSSSLGDLLLYLSQNDVARLEPPLPIAQLPRADLAHPQNQLWLILPHRCGLSDAGSMRLPPLTRRCSLLLQQKLVKLRRCSLMPPHPARGEPLPSQPVAASSRDQSQIEPQLCHTSPPSSLTLALCSKAGSHTSRMSRCAAMHCGPPRLAIRSLQPSHPISSRRLASSLMYLPPSLTHTSSQSNP
jgi:hypothetical protein